MDALFDLLSAPLVVLVPLVYVLGALSALDALVHTRTPQGATAWIVALPLYWVFGRARFDGYLEDLRAFDEQVEQALAAEREPIAPGLRLHPDDASDERTRTERAAFERLGTTPFLRGNDARLLIDGEATFDALFAEIDAARDYVLAQFYIVRDDALGRAFRDRLMAAAARGVRVYLLYDDVGSHSLPQSYAHSLVRGGVHVRSFSGARRLLGRFRLNFRNHRKIVVVDGRVALTGGINIGDEYVGRHDTLTPWRDTHLRVEGPAAVGFQFSFARDWFYSSQEALDLDWEMHAHATSDQPTLIAATGPSDDIETCSLLHAHAIESAERRVWIATPYFVPDGRVLGALQTAALRGVDVRILVPRMTDSRLFRYVPFAYLTDVAQTGAQVHLYEDGFAHQKVLLVDDDYALVGSANIDNRSLRLNFEVTCVVRDDAFCAQTAAMLGRDFARSTLLDEADLAGRSLFFRLAVHATRLLAPVL